MRRQWGRAWGGRRAVGAGAPRLPAPPPRGGVVREIEIRVFNTPDGARVPSMCIGTSDRGVAGCAWPWRGWWRPGGNAGGGAPAVHGGGANLPTGGPGGGGDVGHGGTGRTQEQPPLKCGS